MTNRTAFVTGASRGIGRACAVALAQAGARVVVAARDRAKLGDVAAEIRAGGGEAFAVTIDMGSEESVQEAFATAAKDFGRIDILVNNAAITKDTLALRMKKADWDAVLATNLTGAFVAIQQVLQGMMKERWGRIVNISSVVAEAGNAGQANYAAAKAGLAGMTRSLARELGSRNITVNCVAPGFIDTDMTRALSEGQRGALVGQIPLGRLGKPEEIAAAVAFLASPAGDYVTGTVLHVNGGMFMA
jgi:3-oxoacyl-[acyl-carrier protein] reductase